MGQGPTPGSAAEPKSKQDQKSKSEKKQPPPVSLDKLQKSQKQLESEIERISKSISQDQKRDLLGYVRASNLAISMGEYRRPGVSNALDRVLQLALQKVTRLEKGKEAPEPGTWVCRAYQSIIDDSLQPYAIKFPKGFGQELTPWPLEVVLHGRSDGLNEALFLAQHENQKPAMEKSVIVEVFGRGNNAYRWAGETDVLEVISEVLRREAPKIDTKKIVLRGFSMGGAGTWHLGLHYSDRFCVIQPGAGFTKTIGYAKTLKEPMEPWQHGLLNRYDAVSVFRNVAMVPIVAYSGGDDPQKDAAVTIENAISNAQWKHGIFKHIVAPGLGHKMPPEWKRKVDETIQPFVEKGKETEPRELHWTVNSLRHGKCHWIEVTGLQKHGESGQITAKKETNRVVVQTQGVTHFNISLKKTDPKTIQIGGTVLDWARDVSSEDETVSLMKGSRKWVRDPNPKSTRKRPGLEGPIDDAFMEGFVVTLGKGNPWNESAQKAARDEMERFRKEWVSYMRGDFPFLPEEKITPEILEKKHLVIFGDPGSSALLAQLKEKLPFGWEKDKVLWKGKSLLARAYLPFSIQPNPLAPGKYLVINSGHTFHEEQFKGTNALLFAQHGDHGLLHIPSGLVESPGLYDEDWRFPRDVSK